MYGVIIVVIYIIIGNFPKNIFSIIKKNWILLENSLKELGIENNQTFLEKIQKRGAEIISVRGSSSTFSAANAAKNHLRDWCYGSEKIVSMGVVSNGDYDIPKDLVSSFPIKCTGNWKYEIVQGITLNDGKKEKIKKCVQDLEGEASEIVI